MRTATPKKADSSQSSAGITTAKLSKGAFAVMLANSIEVYKREAMGFLIGRRNGNNLYVSTAVPYQAIINGYASVDFISNRIDRLEDVLNRVHGRNAVIGNYHSHPSYGELIGIPEPSKFDLKYMVERNLPIYVILSVRDKQRAAPWHCCGDGRLAGSFSKFWFDIAAYHIADGELKTIDVECPYAIEKDFD